MAPKRKSSSFGRRGKDGAPKGVTLRHATKPQRGYELVHPRGVIARQDDLDEVYAMLAAGEVEVALDELRWLISGCQAFIEAHKLLGELALGEEDIDLAAGHFGYGFKLGDDAIGPRPLSDVLPFENPANTAFYESGKGYAFCLLEQGKPKRARGVMRRLLQLDPQDPLGIEAMLAAVPEPTGEDAPDPVD